MPFFTDKKIRSVEQSMLWDCEKCDRNLYDITAYFDDANLKAFILQFHWKPVEFILINFLDISEWS